MKTNTFLLTFIFSMLLSYNSFSQVTQEWVARYNGPANSWDWAYSIAVDSSGNVYVTGESNDGFYSDYATVKYNSTGVEQWSVRYNGPGNNEDVAKSIAVDGSGNVYVTGWSMGSSTGDDYATIKYNSSGVEQWVSRYDGGETLTDQAKSIAVDGSGNAYVTGTSFNSVTQHDYVTIKYNTAGVQQWVQRYSASAIGEDYAAALKVDGSGNVYVTGQGEVGGQGYNYVTVKYNTAGAQQWVASYDGTTGDDKAYSIAVDVSGNVYVTGESDGGGSLSDYATVKYNSAGVQQWASRYNGPGNNIDQAKSVAVDGGGNVYVTGNSKHGAALETMDYATIKYNPAGVQQWVQRYNGQYDGSDAANSIVVDGSGNVYVTGESQFTATDYDYITIRYSSSGVEQWNQFYNAADSYDRAQSIALDGSGNVYVTGYSVGNGTDYDYATIKYSQSIGIRIISTEFPKSFSLKQNYPNPFNPSTRIRFLIPAGIGSNNTVMLKVYNVLGSEIAVLVSEKLSPGTYEVDWNASTYPSGVYYYRLETGYFTDTKKMILIK
jgi:uncharacterized delta-60 repeat protein